MFLLPERQALSIMEDYNVSYVLVFEPDELEKFPWIADIAGYDAADYLVRDGDDYRPTESGAEVTLLRLIFDDDLHPQYFTKIFDNGKGNIYRVDYA